MYVISVIENANIMKKAYPTADVHVGSLQQVVTDFTTSVGIYASTSSPEVSGVPTIGILSTPDHGVVKREEQMQEDLKILDSLQYIIELKDLSLDTLVLTFPT